MPANNTEIEKRLWDAADELRANSKLKSSEYSVPVLGLIFLRFADHKFARAEQELVGAQRAAPTAPTGRRQVSKLDYQARGVLYLPEAGRWFGLMRPAVPRAATPVTSANAACMPAGAFQTPLVRSVAA